MNYTKLANSLLLLLIQNHDDGDSLVRESNLKNYCIENFSFTPQADEITKCIELINSSVNRRVIKEGWIPVGGLLSTRHESSYITEFSANDLSKIIEIINSTIEIKKNQNEELENLIKFQNNWIKLSLLEKQQIAKETDRLNNIGAQYYNEDNYIEAINHFKKALIVMPTNNDALKNLIICYKYIGEIDKIAPISSLLNHLGY